MQLRLVGMQCQSIGLIVSIVFVLIDIIEYVNCIYGINCIINDILNFSSLQLKDNASYQTKSGMTFWSKKAEVFNITSIYWHLQRFHYVCLRNK